MWIEKRGKNFVFREHYHDPYTDERKTTSITLTSQSNQAKKQAQKELNEKIERILSTKKMSDHTLGELIDEWWTMHEKTVRNNTKRNYSNVIKYMQRSDNINLNSKISKTDPQFFQRYLNSLQFSYSQNQKYKSVLKMAFDYAVSMGYLADNPLVKTKIPKPPVTLETYARIEESYLEKEEVDRLLNCYYSAHQSVRMGHLIEFMYLTGLRVGEAISLKVHDYQKHSAQLNIHGTLDYSAGYKNAEKEMTKTNASFREIGLSKRAMFILDQVIVENELKFDDYSQDSYIFVGKTGLPIQVNTVNNSLAYNNEKLGKQRINKRLTSHIFRHSHISLLAELNVPIKAIMQRVGHADEKTTLQIYTHVTEGQKTDVIEKLNNLGM